MFSEHFPVSEFVFWQVYLPGQQQSSLLYSSYLLEQHEQAPPNPLIHRGRVRWDPISHAQLLSQHKLCPATCGSHKLLPGKRNRCQLASLTLDCRLLSPNLRLATSAPVHAVVSHALVRSLGLFVKDFPGSGGARSVLGRRCSRCYL